MDIVSLALFKFKHLEGALENWYPHNTTSSVYRNKGREVIVDFNLEKSTAIISDCNTKPETSREVPISELMTELCKMNIVEERNYNRHSSSYSK